MSIKTFGDAMYFNPFYLYDLKLLKNNTGKSDNTPRSVVFDLSLHSLSLPKTRMSGTFWLIFAQSAP